MVCSVFKGLLLLCNTSSGQLFVYFDQLKESTQWNQSRSRICEIYERAMSEKYDWVFSFNVGYLVSVFSFAFIP